MTGNAVKLASEGGPARLVRIPALPGRQQGLGGVDTSCDEYKAGEAAAEQRCAAEAAALERAHENFASAIGAMLEELDGRCRKDCLSLIERLFAAIAPGLAREATIADIMALAEKRIMRSRGDLHLTVHPSLVEHLSQKDQRVLGENPNITLTLDENCAPAAVEARWAKGGMFHDPDKLIEEILAALREETGSQEGEAS